MAGFDIFNSDAFSTTTLVGQVERNPFKPSLLGDMNLFAETPSWTDTVWIEQRDGALNLISTTPRGGPLPQRKTESRSGRPFKTVRIAKGDRMMATELQNIRAFGSETELMQVQAEVARRLSGPVGLQSEVEYTWENMRLGAVQGILVDADTTVLYNFYTEFGISQPTEIAFDLTGANASGTTVGAAGKLRPFIQNQVVRPLIRASKGAFLPNTRITGLCGDAFYDDLTNHGDVRQGYLNWQEAQETRKGNAFEVFPWGGVDWVNYRGSDDNSTIGIPTDKVKFFPSGAPGVFRVARSPAEFMPFINTPGKPLYPMIIPDEKREAYVDIELYSYPLFMCTRPDLLFRGRRGS